MRAANLYVHFPFCRRKCRYCSLHSRVDILQYVHAEYVRKIAAEIDARVRTLRGGLKTVYFGGGSPALCDLRPLAPLFHSLLPLPSSPFPLLSSPFPLPSSLPYEFTVEVHPLDVTEAKLLELKELGVNRLSMGVQSFDDATLADMGRGYALADAERAFRLAKTHFDNVGIDLIVGYPGDECGKADGGSRWREKLALFAEMGMRHCSVYSLQNERGLENVPDDDAVLDRIREVGGLLREAGLERYEISNYAVPGFECRHNLAVWRGEDYAGVGEGACGREGLARTVGRKTGVTTSTVTPEEDLKERTIFRLRTREGLDAARFPAWIPILDGDAREGLLTKSGTVYFLTDRGAEVCDAILAELA